MEVEGKWLLHLPSERQFQANIKRLSSYFEPHKLKIQDYQSHKPSLSKKDQHKKFNYIFLEKNQNFPKKTPSCSGLWQSGWSIIHGYFEPDGLH